MRGKRQRGKADFEGEMLMVACLFPIELDVIARPLFYQMLDIVTPFGKPSRGSFHDTPLRPFEGRGSTFCCSYIFILLNTRLDSDVIHACD